MNKQDNTISRDERDQPIFQMITKFKDNTNSLMMLLNLIFSTLVGVIGSHEELPREVSARKLDESEPQVVKGGINLPGSSNSQPLPSPEPPLSTISPLLPTTDISGIQGKFLPVLVSLIAMLSNMRISVPRALESQLKIDNLQFTPELSNMNSSEYKALAESLEGQIRDALFAKDMQMYGPADIEIKIVEFR